MIKCELRVFEKDAFKSEHSDAYEVNRLFSGTEFQRVYLHAISRRLDFFASSEDLKPECSLFLGEKILASFDETKNLFNISRSLNSDVKTIIAEIRSTPESVEKLNYIFTKKKDEPRWQDPLASQPSILNRPSIFSSDTEKKADLRGFLNLTIIVVIVANLRVIIENFHKYGILLDGPSLNIFKVPIIIAILSYHVPVLIAFVLQYLAFHFKIKQQIIFCLYFILVTATLVVPVWIGEILKPHPGPMIYVFLFVMIAAFKIISFAHVMGNVRKIVYKVIEHDKTAQAEPLPEYQINSQNLEIIRKYKDNIAKLCDIKHYYYFIFAPTLCFQLAYPRTEKIRIGWVCKRAVECVVCLGLQAFVFNQYIIPGLENTIPLVEKGFGIELAERLLKLSIPSMYSWILMFFGIFHYMLNIHAELMRFSDRQFYLEWWNCHNLNEYWRKWNIPVHSWFMRHMYYPLLKQGMKKQLALFLVFFVSAVGHEYIVSSALRMFGYWAFVAMMSQAPIMVIQSITEKKLKAEGSQLGNAMFWISFCFIGQPFCVMTYYYLYATKLKRDY